MILCLIHACDNPLLAEERAVEAARAYDKIAPEAPHALQMPTHNFTRRGYWEDVIDWNERSARAALQYPAGDAISHHYLHALDYLIYARLQRADDSEAGNVVGQMAQGGQLPEDVCQRLCAGRHPRALCPGAQAVAGSLRHCVVRPG